MILRCIFASQCDIPHTVLAELIKQHAIFLQITWTPMYMQFLPAPFLLENAPFIHYCTYSRMLNIVLERQVQIVIVRKIFWGCRKYQMWNWWGWEWKAPSLRHSDVLFRVLGRVAIRHTHTRSNSNLCLSNSVLIAQGKNGGYVGTSVAWFCKIRETRREWVVKKTRKRS